MILLILHLNLFVDFIIIFIIENVTQYVLGVLEHFINKLNKLNDSIKANVDD